MKNVAGRCFVLVLIAVLAVLSGCCNQRTAWQMEADNDWNSKFAQYVQNNATGVAVYGDYLYICQNSELAFIKINLKSGVVSDMPSSFLNTPHALRYYDGFLWIADAGTHQVYKITLDGRLAASYGTRNVYGCDEKSFYKPTDVAVAQNGNIYVVDGYGNRRVVCLDKDGNYLFEWGKEGTGAGEFDNPHNIVIHKDLIYIADRDNERIQVFDMQGNYIRMIEDLGMVFGLYAYQDYLCITRTSQETHSIIVMDFDGKTLAEYGSKGKEFGQFDVPHSLVFDGEAFYVVEVANQRAQRIKVLN